MAENDKLRIMAILASTRDGRNGEHVFNWFRGVANNRKDIEFDFVDLREENLPILYSADNPSSGKYPDDVKPWAKRVAKADGFVWITAEYNHGYPAPLKNAIDLIFAEWNNKPVGFVAYGGIAAGARSVEQLSLVARELQMAAIRNAVHIPFIWDEVQEDGTLKNAERFERQAKGMLDQLTKWASAMRKLRT
jgi:NAD(P)H-dependent FMN reductase